MIPAILSTLVTSIIAFGRQSAVFGKLKTSLWLFSKFEYKRFLFSVVSIVLGGLAIYSDPYSNGVRWFFWISLFLLLIAFLLILNSFSQKSSKVKRKKGDLLDTDGTIEVIGVVFGKHAISYLLEVVAGFTDHSGIGKNKTVFRLFRG